ncbi:MAG: LysM peptidoglycan-binding domain-containing protein [Trueperaceae bacterium]|nr:MAG: LysM peptidoglycan-binding domain-containing protein [Trueperaceae bacterium]
MRRLILPLVAIALCGLVYAAEVTVLPGDALWKIAKRHATTLEAMMKTNGLTNTVLNPGAVLQLPVEASPFPVTSYVVQQGDTLSDIASAFGLNLGDLKIENDLRGNLIRTGQILKVEFQRPSPVPSAPQTPTQDVTYTVAQGDSLSDIAETFGLSVRKLRELNGLQGDLIRTGQVLTVGTATPSPVPTSPETITTYTIRETTYTVKSGDTISGIAQAFNLSVEDLKAMNELDGNLIRVGEVLKLQDKSVTPIEIYTVKQGDSLSGIAQAFRLSVDDLVATNHLDGTLIYPGQVLKLQARELAAGNVYTVKTGDTLYDIAIAFNLSVDALIAYNDLDGTVIRPGQLLQLQQGALEVEPLRVTVRFGDSLWELAQAYDTTAADLAAANNLTMASVIRPGDQLLIPGQYAGSRSNQGGPAPPTIVVEAGDSLWQLARRHNTSVATLMATNQLRSSTLRVGQVLTIVNSSNLSLEQAHSVNIDPRPQASGALTWPLRGTITSEFGYRRLRIGGSNFHTGLDIDGRTGDPIYAATGGVVTHSGWFGGYGNLVIIQSGNAEYYYAHASELLVRSGQEVERGQLIARVGATGRSTGSHLHFEIRVDGTAVDPLPVLQARAER